MLTALKANFGAPAPVPVHLPVPTHVAALMTRLLYLCPCLFNQLDIQATPEATIHFCELTIGKLVSANVEKAFDAQYPGRAGFAIPPAKPCTNAGTIMELLCSEVLANEGIPRMQLDGDKWPAWTVPGHMLLNVGKMKELQALGDILIPCAPTNLLISVKTQAARERLLYSANSIEGIGFGFFNEPDEFWTTSRMRLFKRMGFSAIYLPVATHQAIMNKIAAEGRESYAVNLNGTPLYRPMTEFGSDMKRVAGRSSFDL
ncbi:hypothetical protein [Rhodopseudomonas parapalustris]